MTDPCIFCHNGQQTKYRQVTTYSGGRRNFIQTQNIPYYVRCTNCNGSGRVPQVRGFTPSSDSPNQFELYCCIVGNWILMGYHARNDWLRTKSPTIRTAPLLPIHIGLTVIIVASAIIYHRKTIINWISTRWNQAWKWLRSWI
jgi:predicted Rdx family selenoprotein